MHASKLKMCYGPHIERAERTNRPRSNSQAQIAEQQQPTQTTQRPQVAETRSNVSDREVESIGAQQPRRRGRPPKRQVRELAFDTLEDAIAEKDSNAQTERGNSLTQLAEHLNVEEENASQLFPNAYASRATHEQQQQDGERSTRPTRERRAVERFDAARRN